MKKTKNTDGFSVVEVAIVLLTIAIIGVAGYLVTKNVGKKATTAKTTSQSSSVANVYAGWKSYCDSAVKLCFKYPSSWALTDGSDPTAGTIQTLVNADSTADAQYGNLLASVGDPTSVFTSNPLSSTAPSANVTLDLTGSYNFYTSSITNLSDNDTAYKVVGGYYVGTSENIPSFFVVNASTVTSESLKVGQVSKLQDASFNISNSLQPTNIIIFGAGPITSSPYTPSEAAAWLISSDGKAVQQVLQSFYTGTSALSS